MLIKIKQLITKIKLLILKLFYRVHLDNTMSDHTIVNDFLPLRELEITIRDFIVDSFKFYPKSINNHISSLLNLFREDILFYIEYPYVDKVYRDSYYNYYSTKHNTTQRNCARVSFFEGDIELSEFRNRKFFEHLNDGFLGYITIRPTLPNLIGRTMLSPRIYKVNNFLSCVTVSNVLINGVKLNIEAFPHSSQDGETLACAETTIWSVMEYFGQKYPEYKPTLPSIIISTLSNYSYERQLPSRGLTAEQISFALKEFDFGTRLYSLLVKDENDNDNEAFPEIEFKRLLGYYVESGIPLIASIENDSLGHAIVITGHKVINCKEIELGKYDPTEVQTLSGNILLYDYADFIEDYVVIDDNMPPYNVVPFNNPTKNYNDAQFDECKIKNFIAPLYQKIYLEAGAAKELTLTYLKIFDHHLPGDSIIFKLFYASSRSFKSELNERTKLGEEATEIILGTTMPKFVWIAVFTNLELLKASKANGMVILDATESNTEDSWILGVSPEGIITYDSQEETRSKFTIYNTNVNDFYIFANNLKGGW